jgi:hypothetical protein
MWIMFENLCKTNPIKIQSTYTFKRYVSSVNSSKVKNQLTQTEVQYPQSIRSCNHLKTLLFLPFSKRKARKGIKIVDSVKISVTDSINKIVQQILISIAIYPIHFPLISVPQHPL